MRQISFLLRKMNFLKDNGLAATSQTSLKIILSHVFFKQFWDFRFRYYPIGRHMKGAIIYPFFYKGGDPLKYALFFPVSDGLNY